MSQCGTPSAGGMGRTWRECRGDLPRGGLGHAAHELYREAEGPGLHYPGEVEAKGSRVAAHECLKGGFKDFGAFFGGGKQHEKGKELQYSA